MEAVVPTYDFTCTSCGKTFEAFRSFSQGMDGVVCADDGAVAERVFSPSVNFIMPGRRTQGGRSYGHGHSHAPGTGPHSH